MPSVSPLRTSMLTPSTALMWPTVLAQHAALDRKPDLEVVGLDHDRRVAAAAAPDRASARPRAAPAYRDARGAREDALDRRPARRSCPCFITQTRSAILRTMPRSWVMNSIAMPSRLCRSFSSFEDLRLHGDVERGGRLVGDQQVGLVGERHRDHHALALPAGQLMRIACQPRWPDRECRPASSNSMMRLRAACAAQRPDAARGFRRSASRSCAAD